MRNAMFASVLLVLLGARGVDAAYGPTVWYDNNRRSIQIYTEVDRPFFGEVRNGTTTWPSQCYNVPHRSIYQARVTRSSLSLEPHNYQIIGDTTIYPPSSSGSTPQYLALRQIWRWMPFYQETTSFQWMYQPASGYEYKTVYAHQYAYQTEADGSIFYGYYTYSQAYDVNLWYCKCTVPGC